MGCDCAGMHLDKNSVFLCELEAVVALAEQELDYVAEDQEDEWEDREI